ncbi:TPA: metallopeptidase [Candidatus Bathyarchaeota archaeon]|nr:metallopeptidase [Candidatus Bathyarchaeota archaeon]
MIEYYPAPDIRKRIDEIIELLRFDHVKPGNVYCVRSRGSQSKRIIARIHGLGRIWQQAMGIEATYIIEVISEQFDPLSRDGQDRVLVHELMHIPHGFQGGFRHHKNFVTRENVDVWFKRLQEKRKELGLRKG